MRRIEQMQYKLNSLNRVSVGSNEAVQ